GHLSNDRCLTPSFDKAIYGGHLYSDKAPGLSLAAVPAAEAVQLPPVDEIEGSSARLWAVRVLTSGLAFVLGAFLLGRTAEGLAPGRGDAALVAFALGTIVAPLAATGFAHVSAATLGFAAFLLAWRRRPLEAVVCAAVTLFFLVLACGYFVPYGGTKLGPRFVVPALPFLALGLGPAFARRSRLTGALTVLSVLPVLGLTLVWAPNPPLHQTIWGELARLPFEGRGSRLMRHMTPNALGLTAVGSRWGLGIMAVAAADGLALVFVRSWPRWSLAAAAAAAAALVVGAAQLPATPVDLRTSISGSTTAALPGDEVDFVVTLANETSRYIPHAVLMIELPRGMDLLGR